jgi:rhodanese-related sulfurtransferase
MRRRSPSRAAPGRRVLLVGMVVLLGGAAAVAFARWATPGAALVPAVSSEQVLEYLRHGKTVIFIDAREPEEFAESRIPGAINLSLRELEQASAELRAQLQRADLTIAYCLKDFRGFEVARALREIGVNASSTLAEQGINGWKALGLPVMERGKRSEADATRALTACANEPQTCLKATP